MHFGGQVFSDGQIGLKYNVIIATGGIDSVFGAIAFDGIPQKFFGYLQIFRDFMKLVITVEISINQVLKAEQALVGPHAGLVLLLAVAKIRRVQDVSEGRIVVPQLFCQNGSLFCAGLQSV